MRLKDVLEIDFFILFSVMILMVIGIVFIYSSGTVTSRQYIYQIIFASSGFILVLIMSMLNYGRLYNISLYIYLIALIPLVCTLIFGPSVSGARRWLRLGPVGIQPSEFIKITTIIFLARFLTDTRRAGKSFIRFIGSCLIVLVPVGIIIIQPDLGTAIVFLPILIMMLYISGISKRYIIFPVSCLLLVVSLLLLHIWNIYINRDPISFINILTNPVIVLIVILFFFVIGIIAMIGYLKYRKPYFFWMMYSFAIIILSLGASFLIYRFLNSYQIDRLKVFMNPGMDVHGIGWHTIQSTTAIGAGGFLGKGFMQGTLSQNQYLPQRSTDFIFSIFSEEAGFIGGIAVFVLFLIIILRILRIMKITNDPFAEYICAGLAGMYIFHFLINVGMAMGIMPITGIPLSFMSFGGSALISALLGIGLIQSIYIRRYTHQVI